MDRILGKILALDRSLRSATAFWKICSTFWAPCHFIHLSKALLAASCTCTVRRASFQGNITQHRCRQQMWCYMNIKLTASEIQNLQHCLLLHPKILPNGNGLPLQFLLRPGDIQLSPKCPPWSATSYSENWKSRKCLDSSTNAKLLHSCNWLTSKYLDINALNIDSTDFKQH